MMLEGGFVRSLSSRVDAYRPATRAGSMMPGVPPESRVAAMLVGSPSGLFSSPALSASCPSRSCTFLTAASLLRRSSSASCFSTFGSGVTSSVHELNRFGAGGGVVTWTLMDFFGAGFSRHDSGRLRPAAPGWSILSEMVSRCPPFGRPNPAMRLRQ